MISTEHSDERNCPQCGSHCPADDLQCGRGRRYFGLEEEKHGGDAPDGSLAGLLLRCGRFVHHGGRGMEEQELFQALTQEERAALRGLLEKLSDGWRRQFGQDCLDSGHHGREHDREEHHHKHEGRGR